MDSQSKSIATWVAIILTIDGFGFLGASHMMDSNVVKMMMIVAGSSNLLVAIALFALGLLSKLTVTSSEPTQ